MELPQTVCYWNRYKAPYSQHLFSLQFENAQDCPVSDVLSAEIWINGKYVMAIRHCTHAHATIDRDDMVIIHYFNPQHNNSGCWAYEEKFSLGVVCSSLPKHIIGDAKEILKIHASSNIWDGHQLYNLLEERGNSKVQFKWSHFHDPLQSLSGPDASSTAG